jgi:hypothetical protein
MRLTLFSILTAILLVTATARRGVKDSPPPVASRKNIHVPQRRYPYGWGLGPEVGIEVLEDKEKETKEVKRGTSTPIESHWSVHYCSQTSYCSHDPSIYSLAQL